MRSSSKARLKLMVIASVVTMSSLTPVHAGSLADACGSTDLPCDLVPCVDWWCEYALRFDPEDPRTIEAAPGVEIVHIKVPLFLDPAIWGRRGDPPVDTPLLLGNLECYMWSAVENPSIVEMPDQGDGHRRYLGRVQGRTITKCVGLIPLDNGTTSRLYVPGSSADDADACTHCPVVQSDAAPVVGVACNPYCDGGDFGIDGEHSVTWLIPDGIVTGEPEGTIESCARGGVAPFVTYTCDSSFVWRTVPA